MAKRRIEFMGVLANVDSSILQLNGILEHGLEIASMHYSDFMELILSLNHMSESTFLTGLFPTVVNENNIYHFKNTYEFDKGISNEDELQKFIDFHNNKVTRYLVDLLRLMRLYKQGNISMPYYFYYRYKKEVPSNYMARSIGHWEYEELFTLHNSEVSNLKIFVQKAIDFENKPLNLAFENYELSYQVPNINLQFLTLINGMEILFNPGKDVVNKKHIISDNSAKFLAKDTKELSKIYSKMQDFYEKRSDLIHEGKADISKEDLLELRYYARESIKKFNSINKDKHKLLNSLKAWNHKKGPWKDEK